MTKFDELFHTSNLVVLDGGLGTTLEELFNLDISHTPLWSAKPVLDKPETIIEAHLAFLRAGAKIILTSTYQCSFQTFNRAGHSEEDAKAVMIKAVHLSHEARSIFTNRSDHLDERQNPIKIRIALSLGPFGACLTPAQEFDGYYPPPYGPREFSVAGNNYNSFGKDAEKEQQSIDALARFHLQRLRVFSNDLKAWKEIDCIAFETVPLVREVRAIRKAMLWLQQELNTKDMTSTIKPWWISFVFSDGECPEMRSKGGTKMGARDLVVAALGKMESTLLNQDKIVCHDTPAPTGIGVNCTSMNFIPGVVAEMGVAVRELWDSNLQKSWLVVYPNGGDTYDPITKSWKVQNSASDSRGWATTLSEIVAEIVKQPPETAIWGGVIVGGCCRIGPNQILALKNALQQERGLEPS